MVVLPLTKCNVNPESGRRVEWSLSGERAREGERKEEAERGGASVVLACVECAPYSPGAPRPVSRLGLNG